MELDKVIDKPFWEYLDIDEVKKQDEIFREWLMDQAS